MTTSFEGTAAENMHMATFSHGASAVSTLYNASVHTFTFVFRRAFGVVGSAFADAEERRGDRMV